MERESEELDQSFQAYLRRQQISKKQMNDDASRIWENYSISKAALTKFDKIGEKHSTLTVFQPNFTDASKQDQVFNSTFYDDVNIADVLKDLNEIKRLKSPQFNKNETFPKESLLPRKSHGNKFEPLVDHNEKLFERLLKAEDRIKSTEKLLKPIPIEKEPIDIAPQLTMRQKNGLMNLNTEVKLAEPKPKTNGVTVKANETNIKLNGDEKIEKKNENQKIVENKGKTGAFSSVEQLKPKADDNKINEKYIESSQRVEKENVLEKSNLKSLEISLEKGVDLETNSNMLTNGHVMENIGNIGAAEQKKEPGSELFSPLNANGLSSLPEPKISLIEKEPSVPIGNGINHTPEMKKNGFANKLTTFVSKISDSDSLEMESEQISIGPQRLVKSPDDFWI